MPAMNRNKLIKAALELAVRKTCKILRSRYDHSPAIQNGWHGTIESLEPRLLMSVDPAGLSHWAATDGGNDHYYEVVVRENGISWTDAKAEAEANGGYLATVTSQDENNFVYDLVDDPAYWNVLPVYGTYSLGPWIGGFRPEDAGPDVNEGWEWVTGETWDYENWTNLEPDHLDEQYVHFTGRGTITDDQWANWVSDHGMYPIISYVIEYNPETVAPPNEAPQFDSLPSSTQVKQGDAFLYDIQASDTDSDPLSITVIETPSWLTLTDHGDGTASLHGTPGVMDMTGYQTVTLAVSDGEESTLQTFDIEVLPNQAPAITTSPILSIRQGNEYVYQIEASDPDGEAVSYYINDLPDWLSFTDHGDGTATLQGTPGLEDTQTSYIQIFATDGMEFSTQSFLLDIELNNQPVIHSEPVTETQYGDVYEYLIEATDQDGDPVNFTINDDLPDWLTFTDNGDGTAVLYGTPSAEDAGSSFIASITAMDQLGTSTTQTFEIHVIDQSPFITAEPALEATEGVAYSSMIAAADPEAQAISLEGVDLPDWLVIYDNNDGTAELYGTPGADDVGSHEFTIRVLDGSNVFEQTYTITVVVAPNTAPEITSNPITQVTAGDSYSYFIEAVDIDQDALAFSNNILPDWLTLIDNGDGTASLTGMPDHDNVGEHEVVIEVTDGEVVVQHTFIIDVSPLSRISGVVWNDVNTDGVIDDSEQRLAGWTVYEDANSNQQFDEGELHVYTDENGNYQLTGLTPGEHDIRVQLETSGVLDDYLIRCNWQETYLPLAEHEDVQITQIDDNSFVIGFEDWTDADYDDLIVQLDYGENGQVSMTILERNAAGSFDLVNVDGELLYKGLGQNNKTPVGSVIDLFSGWSFSTSNLGGYQLVFEAGMIVENADFGIYQAEVEYSDAISLSGDLNDYMIRCNWRNTYLSISEGGRVQRMDIDENSYLLGFEDWKDNDFDDLVLKIEHSDNGLTMITVVDRNASGTFDLIDAHTGKKLFHGLGQEHRTPIGTTFRIGDEPTVNDMDLDHNNNGWQHRLQISIAKLVRTLSTPQTNDDGGDSGDDYTPLDDVTLIDSDSDPENEVDDHDENNDVEITETTMNPDDVDDGDNNFTASKPSPHEPQLSFSRHARTNLPPMFNWIRKAIRKHHQTDLVERLDLSFDALSDKLNIKHTGRHDLFKHNMFDISHDHHMDDMGNNDLL